MVSRNLRNSADAYTSSAEPKKNFHNKKKLFVKENNPDTRWGYLYFVPPFSPGSKIMYAKFRVYNGTTIEGGADLTTSRITQDWDEAEITHNNRPTCVAGPVVHKGATVAPDSMWEVDLLAMMSSVSNGSPFFGIRFTMNDGKGEWFHSSSSDKTALRPVLELKWAEPTGAPTNLEPSGNRKVATAFPTLSFDWEDMDGETDLDAIKVQMSNTEAFTAVTFDSGWVSTSVPELDLASTLYGGLANYANTWWRAYARGADGSESPASDPVQMGREDFLTVNILSPTPDGVVTENTPPILWEVIGGPQVHRQVILFDPESGNDILENSGKKTTPVVSRYLEKKLKTGRDYGIRLNVWDGVQRVRNAGVPPYVSKEVIFHVEFDATVDPVTSLAVSRVTPWHWTKLTWNRSTAPDGYEIYANDELVEKVSAADVVTGVSSYAYVARSAQPRQDTTWRVVAIVNGKGSKNNPTKVSNYKSNSVVLSELDGSDPIMFLNHDYDDDDSAQYTIHEVLGDNQAVPIMQGNKGERFSFSGGLYGMAVPNLSAEEELARFKRLMKNSGRDLLITRINKTFIGYTIGSTYKAQADSNGVYYLCGFDFYETGGDN